MSDTAEQGNLFDEIFEEPMVAPEGEDGIGPTLGMNVAPEHDLSQAESRSFSPCDDKVMRGARSA
jgi:hypothetical protein